MEETPVATEWTEIGIATAGPLDQRAEEGLSVIWLIAGATTVVAIGSRKKTRKQNKKLPAPAKRLNIDEPNPNRYNSDQTPGTG